MEKSCFIRDTLFKDLKNEYEPSAGSVLTENVSLALLGSPLSTRKAREQSSSASDVFSKGKM